MRKPVAWFRIGVLAAIGGFAALFTAMSASDSFRVDSPPGALLALVMLAGVAAMAVGAVKAGPVPHGGAAAEDMTPSESFLRLAVRAEEWIARARRYLLLGGLFAGLVWLPVMWFGLTAHYRGDGEVTVRVLAFAGIVAFLACALLWLKRVREMDADLRAWRTRIAALRRLGDDLGAAVADA
jgi:hypothetical protein